MWWRIPGRSKNVGSQSLFRYYRSGQFPEQQLTRTLGAIAVQPAVSAQGSTRERKVLFDAFRAACFDISLAKEAYIREGKQGLGMGTVVVETI